VYAKYLPFCFSEVFDGAWLENRKKGIGAVLTKYSRQLKNRLYNTQPKSIFLLGTERSI